MLLRTINIPDYHGFNVKFCPFVTNRIACVASKNYGIHGGGSVFVFDDVLSPVGQSTPTIHCDWRDGLFDVAWSEDHEDTVVTASGDSTIQIWNLKNPHLPITVLPGHSKEVASIDWPQTRSNHLLVSGSWDGTAKIWDCDVEKCLATFTGHKQKIYTVIWSPLIPNCFASVSGDGILHVWNNQNTSQPVLTINPQSGEMLSCAWNFYEKDILVTAGVDNTVKGWDLRQASCPIFQLVGHSYPIKKIKFSPHMKSILGTVSYDFSTRIWDYDCGKELQCFEHHSEITCGLDFNAQVTGLMADCGWDSRIQIFAWPCLNLNHP